MSFGEEDSLWSKKGGTLTDKSARDEFGLTQEEIVEAIKGGKLQYRRTSMFGNPCLRLLRGEVESLVEEKYGRDHLEREKLKKELAQINSELRKMKARAVSLEKRKAELVAMLGE
jgi:hypothetical protein